MNTGNPWETLGSRTFYDNHILRGDEDQVRHASGRQHPYTALRFHVTGIAVLPIDADGCTYIVGQYRYVAGRFTWELVRGAAPLDAPLDGAKRELHEEAGLSAVHWLEVFRLMASPGITDEYVPCYLAWELSRHRPEPEDSETLSLRKLPFAAAVGMALSGEIVDAASVALLLAARLRAERGELPSELCAVMAR